MKEARHGLAFNPVYLARKLREIERFNKRATDVSREDLEKAVERRLEGLRPLSHHFKGFVLDCACGYGADMLALSRLGDRKELIGIDLAVEGLKRAREELRRRGAVAHLIQADACWLPFRPGIFDAAIISHMLHHHPLPLIKAIVAEVSRVLRPGAFLLVREWCPVDEGASLREEVSVFLNQLAHLKELLRELGELSSRPEVREAIYRHLPVFGFGSLFSSILKNVLRACGLDILAFEMRRPQKRSLDELLKRARERIEDIPASGVEKAFLLARLEELEEKARAIQADGEEAMVLVRAMKPPHLALDTRMPGKQTGYRTSSA